MEVDDVVRSHFAYKFPVADDGARGLFFLLGAFGGQFTLFGRYLATL